MTISPIGKQTAADHITRLGVYDKFATKTVAEKLSFLSSLYQEINSFYNDAGKKDYHVNNFTDPVGVSPGGGAGVDVYKSVLVVGNDYVRVMIDGVSPTSTVAASWGINDIMPLGNVYAKTPGDGYVDVGSTAEEIDDFNVLVVVYEY